jgi:hypothetical protein
LQAICACGRVPGCGRFGFRYREWRGIGARPGGLLTTRNRLLTRPRRRAGAWGDPALPRLTGLLAYRGSLARDRELARDRDVWPAEAHELHCIREA